MDGADAAGLRRWIEQRFVARELLNPDGTFDGLLTGYYEPILSGSRTRERADQVPLLAPPVLTPDAWPTRAQIEDGPIADEQVLVWLDDPIDAYFLHVQGSGRVRLRDGGELRAGYAANNGHPYRSIGRILVTRGELPLDRADANGIRQWLEQHPDRGRLLMQENPRYIFFRELKPADSSVTPPGSMGVPLTPMRSLATDPRWIAPGTLVYVAAAHTPDPSTRHAHPISRLTVSQDTGAAIKGILRGDLFTGSGPKAGELAGILRQPSRFWALEPR